MVTGGIYDDLEDSFEPIHLDPENQSKSSNSVQLTGDPAFDSLIQKLSSEIDISNNEFQNDKMAGNVQRTLLANLIRLIPVAVDAYKKKPTMGNSTALTGLIRQANELFEQIRSVQNLNNQVEYIQNEVIEPIIKLFINLVYDQIFFLKKNLKRNKLFRNRDTEVDLIYKELDIFLRDLGKKLGDEEEKYINKVKQYFLEV